MAHHHDTLFESLCAEIEELDPKANLKTERSLWGLTGKLSSEAEEVRRRERLGALVGLLRTCRRAVEAHITATVALPRRLFSYLPVYRKVFSGSPDDAAATVAILLASIKSDLDVVAKLQKMRAGDDPIIGAAFVHRGWDRVEMHLARRAGELSADIMAYTWAAGEMPWSEFLESMRDVRTDILEKFGPARGEPMVDEVLDLVENADLEEAKSDDGDHSR